MELLFKLISSILVKILITKKRFGLLLGLSDRALSSYNCPIRTNQIADNMYLLTEWEGRTGKYLARGQDVRTERSEVRAS